MIAFDQPKLSVKKSLDGIVVDGTFIVSSSRSEVSPLARAIAEYDVEIVFPLTYPEDEPLVFETGGAIPRNKDHHINPGGNCCVTVWEAWRAKQSNHSIQAYIDGPLKNFFLGQHEMQETGKWPFGEWAHGKKGLVQSYAEVLGCNENETVIRDFLKVLSKKQLRGHWHCPCGSQKRLRHCCYEKLVKTSQTIPNSIAIQMFKRFSAT